MVTESRETNLKSLLAASDGLLFNVPLSFSYASSKLGVPGDQPKSAIYAQGLSCSLAGDCNYIKRSIIS